MNSPKKSNWTAKDGWNYLKKLITRPEKSMTIQEGLIKLKSGLTLIEDFAVKKYNRQSQIYSFPDDNLVSIDFWENGICWHSQSNIDIPKATLAIYLWNDLRTNSIEIEKEIPDIRFSESRKRIEISNESYIKWHWQNLVDKTENKFANEKDLLKLLSRDSKVNKLMSFHQLWDFGLSRYIGEYGDSLKNDLLRAKIKENNVEVRTEEQAANRISNGSKDCLGKGDPKQAYKLIIENLPGDIGWAEYQTLDQFIDRTKNS